MATRDPLDVENLRARVAAGDKVALKTLAAAGYIGASSIEEVPDFSAAKKLMVDIESEYVRLTAEQEQLREQLRYGNLKPDPGGSSEAQARALLSGEPMPMSSGEVLDDLRSRELEVRARLEAIAPIRRRLPSRVEAIRERARAIELAVDARTGKVIDQWAAAVTALKLAIKAEDDLLADLVARGYGGQEPLITNPYWLSRGEALKA